MLYVRNGKTDDRGVGSMYGNKGGSEGIVLMYWLCENDECRCTPTKGMDGYTVFLVLFLVGGSFYLVVGTALNKRKNPDQGVLESLPNKRFWKELPGLAKDGCVFVFYGARRMTNNVVPAARGYDSL